MGYARLDLSSCLVISTCYRRMALRLLITTKSLNSGDMTGQWLGSEQEDGVDALVMYMIDSTVSVPYVFIDS